MANDVEAVRQSRLAALDAADSHAMARVRHWETKTSTIADPALRVSAHMHVKAFATGLGKAFQVTRTKLHQAAQFQDDEDDWRTMLRVSWEIVQRMDSFFDVVMSGLATNSMLRAA
jgi:hypothetical protein